MEYFSFTLLQILLYGFTKHKYVFQLIQLNSGSMKHVEKKHTAAEKNINLSLLQRYFSGSLKDAARSIGGKPCFSTRFDVVTVYLFQGKNALILDIITCDSDIASPSSVDLCVIV